jgi:hypothetical protein
MRAMPDGFELSFTQALDPKSAGDVASYAVEAYTYIYQSGYGSPVVDKVDPSITSVTVSSDGKTVRLTLSELTKGHVHELKLDGIKNAAGEGLLHKVAFYTLNEIPKG